MRGSLAVAARPRARLAARCARHCDSKSGLPTNQGGPDPLVPEPEARRTSTTARSPDSAAGRTWTTLCWPSTSGAPCARRHPCRRPCRPCHPSHPCRHPCRRPCRPCRPEQASKHCPESEQASEHWQKHAPTPVRQELQYPPSRSRGGAGEKGHL